MSAAALSNSLALDKNSPLLHLSSGSPLRSVDQFPGSVGVTNLSLSRSRAGKLKFSAYKRALTVRAGYSDDGRPGMFVGGFILGGIIVGTLGGVYAPQISRALAGADKKDLMRKLPKFIYDEEKALEKLKNLNCPVVAKGVREQIVAASLRRFACN